ncbi:hypothetical protein [Lysobacter firmicutimachus]|uniref:Sel1 repeat family protein n=1 Tax=Lysobacter firmicutimachus TaxID=1792846 RepID=A0ABU8D8D4_9GAMM
MKRLLTLAIALGGAFAAPVLAAPDDASAAADAVGADSDRMQREQFDLRSRMAKTHPNELWRLYGSQAAARGAWDDAFRHFRRAARYADKYSQHRLSLMYWYGLGAPQDCSLAYAWADLAAERQYPQFAILREKMWQALGEAERERALREGGALYDEYGDRAAKPRFERALARSKREITGSRTGDVGQLQVMTPGPARLFEPGAIDLTAMYHDWRFDSARYWAAEDVVWRDGNVEVGPAQTAPRTN